jgi:gamma-glutamyltranspeptidase
MRPAAAIAAPRWCLSRGREVLIEPSYSGLPQALLGVVRVVDDPYSFGSAKVVAWETDGRLTASADGRRDAAVVAC